MDWYWIVFLLFIHVKEGDIMLDQEEFKDKRRIILMKPLFTYVITKGCVGDWRIHTIPVDTKCSIIEETFYIEDDAYEFYKERMESYGFKPFPIIVE